MSAMRFLPLGLLICLVLVFYWFFGFDFLKWETVRQFQEEHSVVKVILIFSGIYGICTIASMPGLGVLDVIGGILFGQWLGFIVSASSATIGAAMVFLAVRYAFPRVETKNQAICDLAKGFSKHTVNYLLFLRLVPIAPFGIINIALGFSKVSFYRFLWTTFVGILPGSFLYTHVGVSIQHVLNRQGVITPNLILNQNIVISLIGLSLLAIIPVFFKTKSS